MVTVLDVTKPETANAIGSELVATTAALTADMATTLIVDVASLDVAAEDRRRLGNAARSIEAFFKPIKKMAFDLHRAICDRENSVLAPVLLLDREKARAISAYKRAQDDLRAQQERAQAELQQRERQDAATAEAAALERAGESDLAAAVIEEAVSAPPPIVALPDTTKGVVSFRRDWKWRFATDEARALQLLPREYLEVNRKALTAYAKAHKSSANLPGVQVYYEDVPLR